LPEAQEIVLEQYFLLDPSFNLNTVRVVNNPSGSNAKPLYMYNRDKSILYYFSVNYLQRLIGIRNSYIHNALLKHGYSNFSLYILEYCEKNNVLVREQYYIDLLVPEYNILKTAGSSLGYKHSTEAIGKIINAGKGRFFSEEARVKMRAAALQRIDQIRSSVARANGRPVLVKNVETGEILEFASQKEASKQLGGIMKKQ
jgi:group I intron endonuclease